MGLGLSSGKLIGSGLARPYAIMPNASVFTLVVLRCKHRKNPFLLGKTLPPLGREGIGSDPDFDEVKEGFGIEVGSQTKGTELASSAKHETGFMSVSRQLRPDLLQITHAETTSRDWFATLRASSSRMGSSPTATS